MNITMNLTAPQAAALVALFSHALQATWDGRSSSAARFTSFGPACLSSGR